MWSEWTQKSLLYPEFRGQHGTASKNLGVKQSVLKSKARTELVESRSYWMILWPATAEPGFLLLFSSCESCPETLNASIKSDDRIHRFRCGKCCCRFKVSWLFWIVLDRYKLVWPHVCNFCSNSLPSSRAVLVHQQLFGVLRQFCRSILPLENSNSVNRCESVVSVRLRGRLSDICFRLWIISTSIWTPFPPEQCLFWICPWTPRCTKRTLLHKCFANICGMERVPTQEFFSMILDQEPPRVPPRMCFLLDGHLSEL